ncbi:hypothetical protein VF14_02615 [Nostoc linckia z18]|uniref:Uncharacterized protein n=2 Tax=Nostoc linckia TaxID=92942 RepID=A0A9Q5Z902_NOSLI|nr:hypothetical protein [Nostoc linckia]PHK41774.1 hypothetical protein VF12_05170 [Nostoc linckia z15]PHK45843.1 hypothetical protein VF13_14345 [Nostoc linckia z16]PHJ69057.1 hypothetical protein VF02_00090 [Nostoc linckia z1]PHJ73208.1 hypothetical protein VF05_01105 [Nostoc linckia z3]PHJ78555.1 hypothetical protein VF03_00090 [Nostoc linckia z2]
MATGSNQNQTPDSPWNPFLPTQRDINRTEELAEKSPIVAGVLTFFIAPVAMIYLNRGVNNLKILGYVFVTAFMLAMASYDEKDPAKVERTGNLVGLCGQVALITENVKAVTLARKRLGSK